MTTGSRSEGPGPSGNEPPPTSRRLSVTILAALALTLAAIVAVSVFDPPLKNLWLDFLGALLLSLVAVEAAVILRQRGHRQATPAHPAGHHHEHLIHLRCTRCHTQFERVDPGTRPLEAECPNCGLKVLLGVRRATDHKVATFKPVHKAVCLTCGEASYVMDKPDPAAPPQPCPHCGSPLG